MVGQQQRPLRHNIRTIVKWLDAVWQSTDSALPCLGQLWHALRYLSMFACPTLPRSLVNASSGGPYLLFLTKVTKKPYQTARHIYSRLCWDLVISWNLWISPPSSHSRSYRSAPPHCYSYLYGLLVHSIFWVPGRTWASRLFGYLCIFAISCFPYFCCLKIHRSMGYNHLQSPMHGCTGTSASFVRMNDWLDGWSRE